MITPNLKTQILIERKIIPIFLPMAFCCWTVWLATHFDPWLLFALWGFVVFSATQLSIFAHRSWTHRSWRPIRILNIIGLFTHTICLDGVPMAWVGIHRKHHRFSDQLEDPHSPFYKSKLHMMFGPYDMAEPSYHADLIKDPNQLWFAKYYWNIVLGWYVLLLLISPVLLFFWIAGQGAHRLDLYICQIYNHRANGFKGPSNTISMATICLSGENWHANHHKDQRNWNFSNHWWQIDLGAQLIKFFVWAKLAKITSGPR